MRTNGTTHFFREPRALALVRERLVRARLGAGGTGAVSAWVAGCSTGDEAYSLVIHGLEAGGAIDVLATDINPAAVSRAELGAYPARHLRHVPAPTRERWFHAERGGRFRVGDEVRAHVRFRGHDLTREPPPGHGFDVVFCRNVMVYFRKDEAQRAVATLAAALRPGGWLIIGASEWLSADARAASPAAASLELEEHDGVMVYRRRPATLVGHSPVDAAPALAPAASFSLPRPPVLASATLPPSAPTPAPEPAPPPAHDDFVAHLRRAGDTLLDAGRCADARTRYLDALARAPLHADLHLRVALSWMHDDELASAVAATRAREALRQCLFLAPDLWPAWLLYAEAVAPTEPGAARTALEVVRSLLDAPTPAAPPPELAGFLGDVPAAREAVERWLRLLERERSR